MSSTDQRRRARQLARLYFSSGCIKHEFCAICQGFGTEMHHPDYSKPALIVWLCGLCHWALHRDPTIEPMVLKMPGAGQAERFNIRAAAKKKVVAAWRLRQRGRSVTLDGEKAISRRTVILKYIADGGVPAGTFSS
jgi:hypothetical protein